VSQFLIRRAFWAFFLFVVATMITYVIFFLIPSSPGRITGFGFAVSPVQAASINSQWHLDVPAYQQYWIFVWNIIRHQSLGYSFQNGASVRWILAQDARVTGSVVLGSAVLWILISLPVGILSALRPRSLFDRFAMVFVLIGISAPPLWLGLILAYVFGFRLGWTPIADYCMEQPGRSGPAVSVLTGGIAAWNSSTAHFTSQTVWPSLTLRGEVNTRAEASFLHAGVCR